MRTPKTRNNTTLTEAAYFQMIRGVLRRGFRYWKPIQAAKLAARHKYNGDNKRQKWLYECASCKRFFKGTEVQVDHIVPVGSLRCLDDVVGFIERLTVEQGYQVLCKACHGVKTKKEAARSKAASL